MENWIPVSSTGMTRRGYLDKRHCPSGRPKSQRSYSCGYRGGMTVRGGIAIG
ncbi:hypothetical protein NOX90_00600 [Wolbachia endosymbiont of Anurida maritima]|uniref:hypothetical protein n=1 Tax=Wolbachia endosymbiont of Anurida maritima TaxID=2850562 RepID=UPI0035CE863E